ncbi:MAG: hypothetical protein EA402_06375 [Planctomycetota bacterium]|nr:MAG: hypothetical protein EA402_06375 [Planctomycetota bacterium]
MDPALLLHLIEPRPSQLSETHVVFAGTAVPVVIPLSWVDAKQAAAWALKHDSLNIATRAQIALRAGLDQQVWAYLQQDLRGRPLSLELERVLALWAAREQARLSLPAGSELVISGLEARERSTLQRHLSRALNEARIFWQPIGLPRWAGPVHFHILGAAPSPTDTAPDLRPALPRLVLSGPRDPATLRAAAAREINALILAQLAPPPGGWPPWLTVGLDGVMSARANGQVPSPLQALRQRQLAGGAAILTLLRLPAPSVLDEEQQQLSIALLTLLSSDRRRSALPSFLDLIRNGQDAQAAIKTAYGLDLNDLLIER